MKRIMLIIISVVMIFTACKESSPEQIDNEENFNGITFGMTKEELSKYYPEYPEKTRTYTYENGEALSLHTENRHISLRIYDHSFSVTITTKDESE